MQRIETLEIEFEHNGVQDRIYPVVLSDEDEMILIDCGYSIFYL